MKRDFQQRLAKLESQASVWRDKLLYLAVAYYLGNPTEVDYPIDAYGHALGYPSMDEFKQDLEKEESEFEARLLSANEKLMAKFGASWDHDSPSIDELPAIVDALERMEAGLSDEYKNHLKEMIERDLRQLRSGDGNKPRDSA